jgi:hypothetical protein
MNDLFAQPEQPQHQAATAPVPGSSVPGSCSVAVPPAPVPCSPVPAVAVPPVPSPESLVPSSLIKPTPNLPFDASAYRHANVKRISADPIGKGGLPDTRDGLNARLLELCNRLAAAGGAIVGAAQLCEEMALPADRSLRYLVAYGHVHHRIRELVGIEGVGYTWGGINTGAIEQAAAIARRKGLCSMFSASLYSHQPAAVQLAQLALDFKRDAMASDDSAPIDAWMAGEDMTPGRIVEAFVDLLAATPEGVAALQAAAVRRPGVFMDRAVIEKLRQQAAGLLELLSAAG